MNVKYLLFYLLMVGCLWHVPFAQSQTDSTATDDTPQVKMRGFKLWGEFYDESTVFQKLDNNLLSTSHIRQGLRYYWTPSIYTEAYGMVRYGKDLNRDFWNNRFEGGLGLRTRFFRKVFLALYLEGIVGSYTDIPMDYPQPDSRKYDDLRGGLIFWYGWDTWFSPKRWISIPMIFWGEIYSEINYFRSDNNNVFGYLHSRAGFHLLRLWKADIDAYGVIYLLKDINKDFWNNKVDVGPGVWIRPWSGFSLQLYIEWLYVSYFGNEGNDPNPYSQRHTDRRMGILLWLGW